MPTVPELTVLVERLGGTESVHTDADRIDLISALETLKAAAAAAQARVTVAFDASQRAAQAAAGVPAKDQGRGVAAQVALARRESAHKGNQLLGLAHTLLQMPHSFAALATGKTNERRASILVRESVILNAEHRTRLDTELAEKLPGLGDAGVEREPNKIACRLDPGSVVRRARKATADRRVTIRPAPDTMTHLTGLLPVTQGVAVYAALTRHADTLKAAGDTRTRGQIMADTLVERVTGQPTAGAVPVEIQLVMTDQALLGEDHEPAHLLGHGPLPAWLARTLLKTTGDAADQAKTWVRRLYTHPGTGELVAMDSRRRLFTGQLRQFLIIRDQVCRTPGATPRSGTSTTSSAPPTADPPAQSTAKANAPPATWSKKHPAGRPPPHATDPDTPSPPHPPATPTPPPHPTHQGAVAALEGSFYGAGDLAWAALGGRTEPSESPWGTRTPGQLGLGEQRLGY